MKKPAVCVAASVLALAACGKGPVVDLHNADTNQVSKAVSQSGVMTSDAMVEPGLWQSKVSLLDMTMPGMPPEFAARMKEEVAKHRNEASKHCIKPEDVKKPKEGFFGADRSCRYDHFTMGGGNWHVIVHYVLDVDADPAPGPQIRRWQWFDEGSLPEAASFASPSRG